MDERISEKESEIWSIVSVFSGQLLFYQMNQLEVSCMQSLWSIANQEKSNQLIYFVRLILIDVENNKGDLTPGSSGE